MLPLKLSAVTWHIAKAGALVAYCKTSKWHIGIISSLGPKRAVIKTKGGNYRVRQYNNFFYIDKSGLTYVQKEYLATLREQIAEGAPCAYAPQSRVIVRHGPFDYRWEKSCK